MSKNVQPVVNFFGQSIPLHTTQSNTTNTLPSRFTSSQTAIIPKKDTTSLSKSQKKAPISSTLTSTTKRSASTTTSTTTTASSSAKFVPTALVSTSSQVTDATVRHLAETQPAFGIFYRERYQELKEKYSGPALRQAALDIWNSLSQTDKDSFNHTYTTQIRTALDSAATTRKPRSQVPKSGISKTTTTTPAAATTNSVKISSSQQDSVDENDGRRVQNTKVSNASHTTPLPSASSSSSSSKGATNSKPNNSTQSPEPTSAGTQKRSLLASLTTRTPKNTKSNPSLTAPVQKVVSKSSSSSSSAAEPAEPVSVPSRPRPQPVPESNTPPPKKTKPTVSSHHNIPVPSPGPSLDDHNISPVVTQVNDSDHNNNPSLSPRDPIPQHQNGSLNDRSDDVHHTSKSVTRQHRDDYHRHSDTDHDDVDHDNNDSNNNNNNNNHHHPYDAQYHHHHRPQHHQPSQHQYSYPHYDAQQQHRPSHHEADFFQPSRYSHDQRHLPSQQHTSHQIPKYFHHTGDYLHDHHQQFQHHHPPHRQPISAGTAPTLHPPHDSHRPTSSSGLSVHPADTTSDFIHHIHAERRAYNRFTAQAHNNSPSRPHISDINRNDTNLPALRPIAPSTPQKTGSSWQSLANTPTPRRPTPAKTQFRHMPTGEPIQPFNPYYPSSGYDYQAEASHPPYSPIPELPSSRPVGSERQSLYKRRRPVHQQVNSLPEPSRISSRPAFPPGPHHPPQTPIRSNKAPSMARPTPASFTPIQRATQQTISQLTALQYQPPPLPSSFVSALGQPRGPHTSTTTSQPSHILPNTIPSVPTTSLPSSSSSNTAAAQSNQFSLILELQRQLQDMSQLRDQARHDREDKARYEETIDAMRDDIRDLKREMIQRERYNAQTMENLQQKENQLVDAINAIKKHEYNVQRTDTALLSTKKILNIVSSLTGVKIKAHKRKPRCYLCSCRTPPGPIQRRFVFQIEEIWDEDTDRVWYYIIQPIRFSSSQPIPDLQLFHQPTECDVSVLPALFNTILKALFDTEPVFTSEHLARIKDIAKQEAIQEYIIQQQQQYALSTLQQQQQHQNKRSRRYRHQSTSSGEDDDDDSDGNSTDDSSSAIYTTDEEAIDDDDDHHHHQRQIKKQRYRTNVQPQPWNPDPHFDFLTL